LTQSIASRKQGTRQAIIAAAFDQIRRQGADQLSLRAIARAVGYSPAGLYEYFDGKADIVQAVRELAQERFFDQLDRVPKDLPPGEYIVNLGLTYIRFAQTHPQEFLLLFTDQRGSIPDSSRESSLARASYGTLDQAVEDAINAGVIKTRHGFGKDEAAYALWSLVHGMAMLQIAYQRQLSINSREVNPAALKALIEGLSSP
jgi:AcrR family transcriptional regulator